MCLSDVPIFNGEYFEVDDFNADHENLIINNEPVDDIGREYYSRLQYSIWIHNGRFVDEDRTNLCDLYGFQIEQQLKEFLQGILTMCNAFQVKYVLELYHFHLIHFGLWKGSYCRYYHNI